MRSEEVRIVENYPREEQEFPAWVIVIDPEQQSQQYIGDQGGQITLESGENIIPRVERWSATIGVITYAEHPEKVKWLYQLAKWILSSKRLDLSCTFEHWQSQQGRDLGFDKMFLDAGRFVYRRGLFIEAHYDQTDYDSNEITEEVTLAELGLEARGPGDV